MTVSRLASVSLAFVLVGLVPLAAGCATTAEGDAEEPGTQAGASSVQVGTTDFCGEMFRVDSRAPKAIGDKTIEYDWTGRVSAIGGKKVSYSIFGPVSSIGDAEVSYNWVAVSAVGDAKIERSLARGRVSRFGDKAVDWSLLVDRPGKIGNAEIGYDLVGSVDEVGGDDVVYGGVWGLRTVTEANRFALCLAIYMHAAEKR
jgi:hypothetical protein